MNKSVAGETLSFVRPNRMALLTPREVGGFLRVSICTLKDWRRQDRGPRFLKVEGRLIRYPWPSLIAYVESALSQAASANRNARPSPQLEAGEASK